MQSSFHDRVYLQFLPSAAPHAFPLNPGMGTTVEGRLFFRMPPLTEVQELKAEPSKEQSGQAAFRLALHPTNADFDTLLFCYAREFDKAVREAGMNDHWVIVQIDPTVCDG